MLLLTCVAAFVPLTMRTPTIRAGATTAEPETFEFAADVSRVMEIIINSLYSDKDVFLRELVSNAADACDKKKFLMMQEGDSANIDKLKVRIKPDKEAGTLVIEDSGIGMTKQELIDNLGKIAQSGTKKFAELQGSALIGQFGVGFYSGFLVADRVEVATKSGDKEHVWSSDAHSYSIKETEPSFPASGTRVTLSLKKDSLEYLDDYKLKNMIKKYSEFISVPIELWQEKTVYDNGTKTIEDYGVVNLMEPLWLRDPRRVNQSEYNEFYKTAFKAYDDPMKVAHFYLEGQVQFRSLLFVPSVLPYELTQNMFDDNAASIKLYVKRVFINDKFEEMIPRWLTFMKGVVDSEDLPLNVGREILQKSKMLSIIRKRLVKKSIDMFKSIKETEDYSKFWKNFGKYIKVGVVEENGDTQRELASLCKFFSTKGEVTLDEYLDRAKDNRTIFYATGESKEAVASAPTLEKLKKMDYEVLLLTEPLDELVVQSIGEYKNAKLVDAANEQVPDVYDEDSKEDSSLEDLKEFLQAELGSKLVSKVQISKRLEESPATLVQGAYGMSPMMRKYMAAQSTVTGQEYAQYGVAPPTLEINPTHPVITKLKDTKDPAIAKTLYDVAALTSGYDVPDANAFAKRVTSLMLDSESPPPPPPSEDDTPPAEDDSAPVDPEVIVD